MGPVMMEYVMEKYEVPELEVCTQCTLLRLGTDITHNQEQWMEEEGQELEEQGNFMITELMSDVDTWTMIVSSNAE